MSNLYWLTDEQMARLKPFFPKSHGVPHVDDRWVLSGIIFVNRNGLRWCDVPKEYGSPKTLYNRWKRWSYHRQSAIGSSVPVMKGVFARMTDGLASEAAVPTTVMIDATYLKAHRTASSLRSEKGAWSPDWQNQGRHEHQVARCDRCRWAPASLLHDCRAMSATTPVPQPCW